MSEMEPKTDLNDSILHFPGGAAYGLIYLGILKYIEDNNINIKGIAGTSIGSLFGACYACGLSTKEILRLYRESGIEAMNGFNSKNPFKLIQSFFTTRYKVSKKLYKLFHKHLTWEKCRIDLYISTTDPHTKFPMYFSNKDTKGVKLADIIYAAMTIPFIFKNRKVTVTNETKSGEKYQTEHYLFDGLFLDNNCAWAAGVTNSYKHILVHAFYKDFPNRSRQEYTKLNVISKFISIIETSLWAGFYEGNTAGAFNDIVYIPSSIPSAFSFNTEALISEMGLAYNYCKENLYANKDK